jgi:hypothetical protein
MPPEDRGLVSGRDDTLRRSPVRGARTLDRGALEDKIGRCSIDCSREQIEQF